MKRFFSIAFLFMMLSLSAQEKINKTNSIELSGEIKTKLKIDGQSLLKLNVHEIGDLVVYNHLGEKKSIQNKLKGVLLKDALIGLELNTHNPKFLSEYFLTIIASDGYKVVFSWNELFNSPTGNNVYLITEKDGVSIDKMNESILLVTTTDFKTGRRNVKAVEKISVGRTQ